MKQTSLMMMLLVMLGVSVAAHAQEEPPMPPFSKDDRVLIFAPHPDDESIGCAGVIQQALAAGADVRVCYFTNGDHNELSFVVYEKKVPLFSKGFIKMGELRRKEATLAMEYLQVGKDRLTFLSYPDWGTMRIMMEYWETDAPFMSLLTRIKAVPYPEALSYGAPYVGESVLGDITRVIAGFRPTKVFVSHPVDANRDHRALYLFVTVAIWDLEGRIAAPAIFPYIVHVPRWPQPRGYHPRSPLTPPYVIGKIGWRRTNLGWLEVRAKRKAIRYYRSQIEYEPSYLISFARRNELFGGYPDIDLRDGAASESWQDVRAAEEIGVEATKEDAAKKNISALAYQRRGGDLYIRFTIRNPVDEAFGVNIHLLGYRKGTPFARMPKVRISVNGLRMEFRDKKRRIRAAGAKYHTQGKDHYLRVPLAALGNPDRILASMSTFLGGLDLDETAWRVLVVE
ncbi:MAG TPA: PIG-L family deacetylase [bacterium]|nr:PIG-L family deacetylase [bacterium]